MSDRQPPDSLPEAASNALSSDIQAFELNLLKEEYFFIQNIIEDYNKQIWVIKALGITGTGALLGLALQQKQNLFALIGCAIPIFFWILESQWKHFQRGFSLALLNSKQYFSMGISLEGQLSTLFGAVLSNVLLSQSGKAIFGMVC
ncbi:MULTISPECIES: hypothetical protein [Cyanophyceae]|uniref:hypothetical protein n=1 Tax=Cyanophyceae TaxID=3028117 RepID=UPI0018EFC6ED|nr:MULTISPECIES: hypothetical protein [Cyanophyceae]